MILKILKLLWEYFIQKLILIKKKKKTILKLTLVLININLIYQ